MPTATYRIQLHAEFGFEDARALVPYLAGLGVDTLYLSPVWAAVPGSTHGYDVVDPTRVNPELGGEEGLRALWGDARAAGLGMLFDIVPNHMAAHPDNPWWWAMLRDGPDSEAARFFDVDWDAQGGRVLLPALGDPLAEVLERGELRVDSREGVLRYFEHRFPLAEGTAGGAITDVLARQHYRLAYWRLSAEEINYRRFFDISDLVSVRVEDPAVFEATHALILRLVREGVAVGLRVDHVDGLLDPTGYLHRLREAVGRDVPIVVEKILGDEERLPAEWPVQGTTGYEFAEVVGDVLLDGRGARRFDRLAAASTGDRRPFRFIAAAGKRVVLRDLFGGQVRMLVDELQRLATEALQDLPRAALDVALREVVAQLPVYRTYVRSPDVREQDRRWIETAVARAGYGLEGDAARALRFVRDVLLLEPFSEERLAFVMRWQRLTGPATAKGVEDTALYRYPGLLSRAEVGATPETLAGPDDMHEFLADRNRAWPGSLNGTTTHDTKRSEDLRARLAVLSETPDELFALLSKWRKRHPSPDDRLDLHVYQAMVGAWPHTAREKREFPRRLAEYAVKAAREAKLRTSWVHPDGEYERDLERFVRATLRDPAFDRDVERLLRRIGLPGAVNALAQVLIKATAPGVPDLYQGAALWELSLVDPDNRRPVAFGPRIRHLEHLERGDPRELLKAWRDGRIKQHVTATALRHRLAHRELFRLGEYVPLAATGRLRSNVLAFARRLDRDVAVTIAPRLVAALVTRQRPPLGDVWRGTRVPLPDGTPVELADVLTGGVVRATRGSVALADAFATLPLALLVPA